MAVIQTTTNLFLLPGLGTDERLFVGQRAAGLKYSVPVWIEPRRRESLASYGKRMAQTIDTSEPFVLGGVSLGAMVALEMAKHVRPRAVVVIAGTRSCDALPRWMRTVARCVSSLPTKAYKPLVASAIGFTLRREKITSGMYALLNDMYVACDARFFKWAGCAAARWRLEGEPLAPVHVIHGSDDRLFRSAHVDADMVIDGGGHMINLTHAEQVTQRIMDVLGGS
jgi:pimeloyl-ACP methyl ester carboxylesterase